MIKALQLGASDQSPVVCFFVEGRPAPQGSKDPLGRGRMKESSPHLARWRSGVTAECLRAVGRKQVIFRAAVHMTLAFVLKRPVKMSSDETRPAIKPPDIDKLARATLDGITSAGIWIDDSQVTALGISKRYADPGEEPGCLIEVREIE